MAEWWYRSGDAEHGPVSWDELKRLAGAGWIGPATPVRQEGASAWALLGQVQDPARDGTAKARTVVKPAADDNLIPFAEEPPPAPPYADPASSPDGSERPGNAIQGLASPAQGRRGDAKRPARRLVVAAVGVVVLGVAAALLSRHVSRPRSLSGPGGTAANRPVQSPQSPRDEPRPSGTAQDAPSGESPNRIHGVWIGKTPPEFRDSLPLKLTGKVHGAEIENGKLAGGRFSLPVQAENRPQNDSERLRVLIPEDERLLFVTVTELDPQSYLGKARGYAQRALPTVALKLDGGRVVWPAGKYAFARIGGQWWFECIFLDQTARDAETPVPIFDKIRHDDLIQPDSIYVYLFMVPVGARPVELLRAGAEGIPLKPYNLVAK